MARKQIVVIGLGRFGSSVVHTLYQMGHDVLGIDSDEVRVQDMLGKATYSVRGDATNEAVLRELGVPDFDVGIVAIGSDIQSNIMTTVLLKSFGLAQVVARATNQLHGQTLERVGADQVVYPEQQMGLRLARNLFNPGVLEYMEVGANFGVSKLRLPESMSQQTLKEAGLAGARDKYGLAVLAIRRGKKVIHLPAEEERLQPGDVLIIASETDRLSKLFADQNGHRASD
jgi:trk system potassium uptake protein TrkA